VSRWSSNLLNLIILIADEGAPASDATTTNHEWVSSNSYQDSIRILLPVSKTRLLIILRDIPDS
jgi:hypothetical protein